VYVGQYQKLKCLTKKLKNSDIVRFPRFNHIQQTAVKVLILGLMIIFKRLLKN
jgi:hypothetical protein